MHSLFLYACIMHEIDFVLRHKNVFINLAGPDRGPFCILYIFSEPCNKMRTKINETKKSAKGTGFIRQFPDLKRRHEWRGGRGGSLGRSRSRMSGEAEAGRVGSVRTVGDTWRERGACGFHSGGRRSR